MIPRRSLVVLYALGGAVFVAGIWLPPLILAGFALNCILTVAAIFDYSRTVRPERIEVLREVSEVLSVGAPNLVTLRLINRSPRPLRVEVTDEPPDPSRAEGIPFTCDLVPQREVEAAYHLHPLKRGPNRFPFVHLRYPSPYGLWTRTVRRPLVSEVRIYPDIRTVRRFDLLARRNRLSEMGLKLWRLKGREG